MDPAVDAFRRVTLVGAGPVAPADLRAAAALAPRVIAADGGAGAALAAGLMPERVIGDIDSLAEADRARLAGRLFRVAEQETTDFEKCLTRIEAPLVLALGFTGGRIDHELAVWNALARHPERPCIVIGGTDLAFAAPPELTLDLPAGSRLSLFPMGPVRGRSEGLDWPIDGLAFAPDGRIGTSNRVAGPVRLAFAAPGMLVILPRAALAAAMAGLAAARPADWPAEWPADDWPAFRPAPPSGR